jgi:hypothetical protein
MSLTLNDNVVLTDLAYEKAKRLGMSLVSPRAVQPPAAPIRPYLSKEQKQDSLDLRNAPAPDFFGSSSAEAVQPAPVPPPSTTNGITALAQLPAEITNPAAGYPQPYSATRSDPAELRQRVREAVLLRMGTVDPALLDKIIQRVFAGLGIE